VTLEVLDSSLRWNDDSLNFSRSQIAFCPLNSLGLFMLIEARK